MADMMDMMSGDAWDESMFDDIAGDRPDILKKVTFLIDHSGSMDGTTIGTINSVMEEILSELDEHKTRIAVAEIDEEVQWKTEIPVSVSHLGSWERTRSGSFSNLGAAFSQLADRLGTVGWQEEGTKGSAFYFILFSDGLASDDAKIDLKKLAAIPDFQNGKRMSINFSSVRNDELLSAFAGGEKNVIQASGSGAIDMVENAVLKMLK